MASNRIAKTGKAQSSILIWLNGGPSHIDMWDTKPNSSFKVQINKKFSRKINYVKLNIYPDGGISRFRIYGKIK